MSYYDRWMAGYSLLTNEMPENLSDWPKIDVENVEREGNALFTPYIFRRAGKEDTELWCSRCLNYERIYDGIAQDNATLQVLWSGHKDKVHCPHCGQQARLIDTKYIRTGKSLRESHPMVVLTERDGDIYARAYWMKKDYSKLPTYEWGVRPMFYLVGAYRFTEGRAECWAQHYSWNKFDCEAEEGKINPSRRKVREPFTEGSGSWLSYAGYAVAGIEAIEQSRFRYCQYMEHERPVGKHHSCLMRYLAAASIYPRQVEMLHKMGFNSILDSMVEGRSKCSGAFNWEAKDPAKAFGLTKQELQTMPKYRPDIITWYKRFRKAGMVQDAQAVAAAINALPYGKEGNAALRLCLRERMRPEKLVSYLEKQRRQRCYGAVEDIATVWRRLVDYHNMAAALGWDMSEFTVRFPRDLNAKHDEAAAENQLRIEREKAAKLAEQQAAAEESLERRRKKYNIEAEGYVLRIADNALEVIEEGRVQKHCVAGYAERHLADKRTIMFLRWAETPNTALYTIEMNGNRLVQIHGYKNDRDSKVRPRDEMAWLLDPWLKWLEAGSPRDEEGRAKIKFTKEERKTA